MEKLADLLYYAINAFYYDNKLADKFHGDKDAFWADLCHQRVRGAAWGLLYVANKHV